VHVSQREHAVWRGGPSRDRVARSDDYNHENGRRIESLRLTLLMPATGGGLTEPRESPRKGDVVNKIMHLRRRGGCPVRHGGGRDGETLLS